MVSARCGQLKPESFKFSVLYKLLRTLTYLGESSIATIALGGNLGGTIRSKRASPIMRQDSEMDKSSLPIRSRPSGRITGLPKVHKAAYRMKSSAWCRRQIPSAFGPPSQRLKPNENDRERTTAK